MTKRQATERRLPVGAEVVPGGVHVRVWAPGHVRVDFVPTAQASPERGPRVTALQAESGGYFSGLVVGAAPGDRYRLAVDGGRPVPDPASRFQPEGPHGPSEIVDPSAFAWTDRDWPGPELGPRAMYELHIGTFTREGSFDAARQRLPDLAGLGIGIVELMPLAEFPGRFGWGYDGVDLFAPSHLYGSPDDLRRLIDTAHGLGIGVILDVVYNHIGPDGCYLGDFSPAYLSRRHTSDWGETFNFDDEGSESVREFVLGNARYWIDEFHFDGLRVDATQQIFDDSRDHILAAISRAARAAAGERRIVVVAENEPQDTRLVRRPEAGGFGLDALWNDDLHHSVRVALTGRAEAYYSDYRGNAQELVSAARFGFLFQGQRSAWQMRRRGTPALDLPPTAFVSFIENHDQVANSERGERISRLTSPGRLRAMTAYLLLGPGTPLLFMGQEFAASSQFMYFADHGPRLARAVASGRKTFLAQFESLADPAAQARLSDPAAIETFEASKLDHGERDRPAGAAWLALHTDLLALRRAERVFGSAARATSEGAVLADGAFLLRFFPDDRPRGGSFDERLLVVNLEPKRSLAVAPEPLLAPPDGAEWRVLLTTDDPRYGGRGRPAPNLEQGVELPAEAAIVLVPVPHRGQG